MKFIYFTDIHLDTGINAQKGFELCVESMLVHQPEVLINGGDLGLTPEVLAQYAQTMEEGICAGAVEPRQPRDVQRLLCPGNKGGRRTPAPILAASTLCCWTWCAISSRPRIIRPTGTSWPTRVCWNGWLRIWRRWTDLRRWWWPATCLYRRPFPSARVRCRTWLFPPMRLPGHGAC